MESKKSAQQDDAKSQVSQAKSVKSVAASQRSKASAVPTEEAKHEAYTDRLDDKRMSNYSIAALREYVQEMAKPGSGVLRMR